MYGDGWIWLGTADVSGLWFGADRDVNISGDGLVAVAPASKQLVLMLFRCYFSA